MTISEGLELFPRAIPLLSRILTDKDGGRIFISAMYSAILPLSAFMLVPLFCGPTRQTMYELLSLLTACPVDELEKLPFPVFMSRIPIEKMQYLTSMIIDACTQEVTKQHEQ